MKLVDIRLYQKDQVRGNYILMTSGPVIHAPPGHRYRVSEEQVKLLDRENIRYSIILDEDNLKESDVPSNTGKEEK